MEQRGCRMPITSVGRYEIRKISILDPSGQVDAKLEPKLSTNTLKSMFQNLILTRAFDERAIKMQRQGKMGPYPPALGQEAIHVGVATAMAPTDWVVPSFREQGVYLTRGIKAAYLFLYFMGTEEANRISRSKRILPICVPCASQILHAVGIAMAAKIKQEPVGVVTIFGDGATSEGDFHEGLNFAGVYQTPNIFICQNNQWAISTRIDQQTHSTTLAQKAIAYGFEGSQVDGNDILAVYRATDMALLKAREGGGPSLLECLTYRVGLHTTSDDPTRYRQESEVEAWKQQDPLDRFEKYLLEKKVIEPGEREETKAKLDPMLKAQALEAQALCQDLNPEQIFDYLYAQLPPSLKQQKEDFLSLWAQTKKVEAGS